MADHTHIEWTDATWNPVTGCSIVSPGCTNCYAMKLAGTRLKHHPSRAGLTIDTKARGGEAVGRTGKQGHPVWNGQVRLNEGWLTQPLQWKRPRMIFVCAHGDLFAENVPDEWIDRVFAVMALAPQHTFQVLTKRAKRMREYVAKRTPDVMVWNDIAAAMIAFRPDAFRTEPLLIDRWPLPNVWLGVSAERQQEADERVPELLATPAAIRFVSAEPLLGPIDFYKTSAAMPIRDHPWRNGPILHGIDWIIVGGESGHDARPMHPAWARQIRDQCAAAGVAFFFKQWGEHVGGEGEDSGDAIWFEAASGKRASRWLKTKDDFDWFDPSIAPHGPMHLRLGKKRAGRLLDGIEHNGMPAPGEVPAL